MKFFKTILTVVASLALLTGCPLDEDITDPVKPTPTPGLADVAFNGNQFVTPTPTPTASATPSASATATPTSAAPVILSQPGSVIIPNGLGTTLSVAATGSGLTYQWFQGLSGIITTPISGATSNQYITPALTSTTNFWVRVTNTAGSASSTTATVTVIAAPVVNIQPANSTIAYNTQASLLVGSLSANLTYQWYQGISGDVTTPVSGATSSTLVTPLLILTTQYWVRITNIGGSADSASATVTVSPPVAIVTQPENASVMLGGSVTLLVGAIGNNLVYQWYIGSPLDTSNPAPNGTTASLNTPPAVADTTYWVLVSNTEGFQVSNGATVFFF